MPTLVHLADERESSNIKTNGIKIGKRMKGVFCMPVMQNFYVSHQWLRELKRFGGNTFVGVYFKVDSSEKVFAGKFNEPHRHIELGEAIKEILSIEDPLGYELIICRKIEAKEIHKIKSLPQTIGWRYKPGSNGKKPCGCDYCQIGKIKAKSIREKYEPKEKDLQYDEILSKLQTEKNESDLEGLLWAIRKKKRSADPMELLFLMDMKSITIDRELAISLKKFRHKNTKTILLKLLDKSDDNTREYAADSFLKLYGQEAEKMFIDTKDFAIQTALTDWRAKQ